LLYFRFLSYTTYDAAIASLVPRHFLIQNWSFPRYAVFRNKLQQCVKIITEFVWHNKLFHIFHTRCILTRNDTFCKSLYLKIFIQIDTKWKFNVTKVNPHNHKNKNGGIPSHMYFTYILFWITQTWHNQTYLQPKRLLTSHDFLHFIWDRIVIIEWMILNINSSQITVIAGYKIFLQINRIAVFIEHRRWCTFLLHPQKLHSYVENWKQ